MDFKDLTRPEKPYNDIKEFTDEEFDFMLKDWDEQLKQVGG